VSIRGDSTMTGIGMMVREKVSKCAEEKPGSAALLSA